jgi:hypothetical protein
MRRSVILVTVAVTLAQAAALVGAHAKGGPGEQIKAVPPATSGVQVQPQPSKKGGPRPAHGCGKPFVMPDESFRTLDDVRDASLWVDDVDSGLLGGFDPFEIYVVTGRLYAPFQLRQGKLGRDNFRKYTANNYNTLRQGPLTLSSERPRGDLAFTQDDRRFTLKVTAIQPSTFGRDTITVQLCW